MSRPTLDPAGRLGISDTGLSPSPAGLPSPFSYLTPAVSQSEPQHARTLVWALSVSLAATLEIDVSFSSSGYLDVSVPRVPFLADDHPLRWPGFPIRISTDQYSLAVPRGFSQLTASFFGSWRLGIHRMPLVA